MKLELRHLAPYLPYGLKIRYILGKGSTWTLTQFNIEQFSDVDKPILRPLSDLTKEIEHNGETFVPLRELEGLFPCVEFYNDDELHYLFSDTDCRGEFFHSIELNLTLEISSKLLEWHFDVFNLHENGLCIYYNEL